MRPHEHRVKVMVKKSDNIKPCNSTDRDMFGTPKNRSKTWDIKKSRNPKQDRRKSKKDLQNDEKP